MSKVIERTPGRVHINLTKPLLGWLILFTIPAIIFESWLLFVIGVFPLVFTLGFFMLMAILFTIAGIILYAVGLPITVTTPRRGPRIIQRKRRYR